MPILLAGALLFGVLAQALLHATPIPSVPLTHQRAEHFRVWSSPPSTELPPYPSLLQYPLFSTGPANGNAATDVAPPGSFSLLGLGRDGAQASVVIRSGDAAIHVAKQGQAVLGWRLVGAGAGRALLVRNGVSQTLVLGAPPKATTSSLSLSARP